MKIEYEYYTGKYPCLCVGVLLIRVDGKQYSLSNILKTGGSCGYIGGDYDNSYVDEGEWELKEERLPQELLPYKEQILEVVNKNVPHGCCGGCL